MNTREAGFSLIELLVTLVIVSIIMTGVVTSFATLNSAQFDQDRMVEMEDNLRMGMSLVTDSLRNAGVGVPDTAVATWLPAFPADPPVVLGANTLRVASCMPQNPPVTLTAAVVAAPAAGSVTLNVNSSAGFATGNLIQIDTDQPARVTGVSGTTLTIDTNMILALNQGVPSGYSIGTPICRVVTTNYRITTVTEPIMGNVGLLERDIGDGAGFLEVVRGITTLAVTQPAATTNRYQVALTAATKLKKGTALTRNLVSDIAILN